MQFDRTAKTCANNYTNEAYIKTSDDLDLTNTEEYWFIRMLNKFSDSELYSSKNGIIEINKYPPNEFRIWVCVQCINDFQTVMTKPFMIDMQCGASSTTITIPDELDSTYGYNNKTQTYEATNEQDSIYFEFEAWTSTTTACPIIEYKVTVTSIVETNHGSKTPNYLYGKDASSQYVYESSSGYICSGTNCGERQQPTFANNTVTFTKIDGTTGDDKYSPDDIEQYTDEDQTSLKRNGGSYRH